MFCKLDNDYVQRDLKLISVTPAKALAPEEVRKITAMCLDDCIQAYQERVIALRMVNQGETPDDLVGEAYILFTAVLKGYDHKEAKEEKSPLWKGKRKGYLRSSFMRFFQDQLNSSLAVVQQNNQENEEAYARYLSMSPNWEAIKGDYDFDSLDERNRHSA